MDAEAPKMTTDKEIPATTTGIGSLPHHNIDAALSFSFKTGIPFLPQIPIRNPWEYMIAQALENLPGLQVEREGEVSLNLDLWKNQRRDFGERLSAAFKNEKLPEAFERFEPSPATSSSWQAFLWELQEAEHKIAKIQIAGPLTSQWVVRPDQEPDFEQELSGQIFRLVLAKSLAMTRKLRSLGITPILFLDEPGLYAFDRSNPKHALAFQELKFMIQALKKDQVVVGLHCCSNTDWKSVLQLEIGFLSIDCALSLDNLIQTSREELLRYLDRGGRLSLGIVPTTRHVQIHSALPQKPGSSTAEQLFVELSARLSALPLEVGRKILKESLFTPACGLALQSIPDAESILETLTEFEEIRKGT
jgi:hypothetical protein